MDESENTKKVDIDTLVQKYEKCCLVLFSGENKDVITYVLNQIKNINPGNIKIKSASLQKDIEHSKDYPFFVLSKLTNYEKAKLLIIEDAGISKGRNGIKEAALISYILYSRALDNLPTIITTPLNRKEFSSYLLEDSLDIVRNKWDTFYFLYDNKHIRKYVGN